jgi:hypothetical protein
MSEEALQRLLERINADEAFAEALKADWEEALAEFDLSPTELTALGTQDDDALRRLSGAEVAGHWIFVTIACTYGCRPPNTPGSGKHCGTGRCPGTAGSGQGCGTGGNCGVVAQ